MEAIKTDKVVFEIRPRRRQDGFTLTSEILLYPLWYTTFNEAVSYARFITRYEGCQIQVFDQADQLVDVLETDPRHPKRSRSPLSRFRRR